MGIGIIETLVLLVAALFLMIKSSICMLQRKNIILFLPVFLFGLAYCFQASFFYFANIDLTVHFQNSLAFAMYVFYIVLFLEAKK